MQRGSSGVDLGLYRSLFRVKRQENRGINGLDLLLGVLLGCEMREEKALTRGPKLSARGRWVPVVGHREEGRVERRGPQGKMGLGGVLGRAQGERERSRPGARGVGPRLGFQEFSLFFFISFLFLFPKPFQTEF